MNLYKSFIHKVQKNPNKTVLVEKINNQWKEFSYSNIYARSNDCIYNLKQHHIQKNDHVIYKGKNSVDWLAWNMATLSLGAVWVPIYHNQNNSYINHIIQDSKAKLLIHDNKDFETTKNIRTHYSQVVETKNEYVNYEENDLSHIIYTSGTSGSPKGVMLTHQNLYSNIQSLQLMFPDLTQKENIKTLNILPWAHIYSLNTELYYNLLNENIIYLNNDPNQFLKDLVDVRPHVLYLVPRVLEEIHKKLNFLDKPLIHKVIPFLLSKLFGPNLITIFMGGAKLHPDNANFFSLNGINICEGYGTTEASPMISVNHIQYPRDTNSIGAILDKVDVQIINGEICVNGPNISKGYWNDKEKTESSFIFYNGKKYYKTGDEGSKKYNYLYYKGRKSNNYKLTNGKFISVDYYEKSIKDVIKNTPLILYGVDKPYNILIMEKNESNECSQELITKINETLPKYAHIKDILELKNNAFSNFLTPKMSLKRKELINYYQEEIDDFYESL